MIHWLLQSYADCPEVANGQAPLGLLNAAEIERLGQFTVEKRRREWLLGRYTVKQLVQKYLELETGQRPPLDALVIGRDSAESAAPVAIFDCEAVPMDLPAGARWSSAVPLVSIPGRKAGQHLPVVSGMRLPVSLSVSHCGDTAFCALYVASDDAPTSSDAMLDGLPTHGIVQIGADIERIEPRSEGFVQAYFSPQEITWIDETPADLRQTLITATWSAKEAVLKSLLLGLSVATGRVTCLCDLSPAASPEWRTVRVRCDPTLVPEALQRASWPGSDYDLLNCPFTFTGWWRVEGAFVLTLVALQIETGDTLR